MGLGLGWQHPTCTVNPPGSCQSAAVTPCAPTRPALPCSGVNKLLAMHSPAGRRLKRPAGRWRWGNPEIQGLCPGLAPASEIPGQDFFQLRDSQIRWEEGSAKRWTQTGTESSLSRWKQRQDRGTHAGTNCRSPLMAQEPGPQHQPLQLFTHMAGAAAPGTSESLWKRHMRHLGLAHGCRS